MPLGKRKRSQAAKKGWEGHEKRKKSERTTENSNRPSKFKAWNDVSMQ